MSKGISNNKEQDRRWQRLFFRLSCVLCALVTLRMGVFLTQEALQLGVLNASLRYQIGISLAFLVFSGSFLLWLGSFWKTQSMFLDALQTLEQFLQQLGKLNLLCLVGINLILSLALVQGSNGIFRPYSVRVFAFALLVLLGLPFAKAVFARQPLLYPLALSLLISTITLQLMALLTKVSTYPFTLEWSEASRYYYASLFFGERIYGVKTAWSVLHPSRYLLQSLPFLLPYSPLWLHRLWQVILWVGISGLTAHALIRLFGRAYPRWLNWMGIGWVFLYLLLGPVYYHLQVAVLAVLLGFQPNAKTTTAKGISVAVLIFSSLWAGLSRLNWYPMPALIAILLYLIETPYRGPFWRYFWRPLVWGIAGIGLAFAAHQGYVRLSGNPPEWFGTSLSSQLLWYRLLPNATYPLGILLASWTVILPLGLPIYMGFRRQRDAIHPWRWVSLLAILLVLYLGGLVVSVKIGGGSNLHNLDAFWTSLGLVFVAVMTQSISLEPKPVSPASPSQDITTFLKGTGTRDAIVIALILPSLFLLSSLEPFFRPDWVATEKALRRIQGLVKEGSAGGEVLLISERQLLTFGYLQGVRLVPEYERVFLMEMAMANNRPYLEKFYQDLRQHRFALIINEPLYVTTKGSPVRFGEENDAWVEHVSKPLLCYYKPIQQARMLLMGVEIQVLQPRSKPAEGCP